MAFTLIEVLIVIAIIVVLTGLILTTIGYVQKKEARARAETEIAAISAACESYKADNGIYPRDPTPNTATDKLNAKTDVDPTLSATNPSGATYPPASLVLYRALSGDRNLDRAVNSTDGYLNIDGSPLNPPPTPTPPPPRSYFTFKPNMLTPAGGTGTVTAIADPFGNSYGYSTANQYNSSTGYNPTFDFWSTAGIAPSPTPTPPATQQNLWIKNW